MYKDLAILEAKRVLKVEKLNILRDKQSLSAVSYDKLNVEGGRKANIQEDLILSICQLEKEIEQIDEEMKLIQDFFTKLEEIGEEYNDNVLLTLKLKNRGYTNEKIAEHFDCSTRTITRWLEKAHNILSK